MGVISLKPEGGEKFPADLKQFYEDTTLLVIVSIFWNIRRRSKRRQMRRDDLVKEILMFDFTKKNFDCGGWEGINS